MAGVHCTRMPCSYAQQWICALKANFQIDTVTQA